MNSYRMTPAGDRLSRTPARRRTSRPGLERLEDRSLLALFFGSALGAGGNGVAGIETTSVAVDSSGNRYVAGSFSGTVDFKGNGNQAFTATSNGLRDGFVAKYDYRGTLFTLKTFGGSLNDRAAGVALDANGNVFVTGYYQGSVTFDAGQTLNSGSSPAAFVWEFNPGGTTVFLKSIPTTGSVQPQSIAVDPTGTNFAVGGFFTGTLTAGAANLTSTGDNDGFVVKGTVSGSTVTYPWASQLAATTGSQALVNSVALDPSGNVVAAGQYQGTVDFDPGPGTNVRTSNNNATNMFVEKFASATGGQVYVLQPGGNGQNSGWGVTTDSAGNAFVIGSYQGTIGFVLKGGAPAVPPTAAANTSNYDLLAVDPAGGATVFRALNALTNNVNTGTPSIAVNAAGTLAVALTYTGPSNVPGVLAPPATRGGSDILIETLDGQGNLIQQASGGGAGDDQATSVAINNAGKVGVAGSYQGPATFGGITLPNKYTAGTGTNIFVASMRPSVVVPGDFLGNGSTQVSVYRPSSGQWFVQGGTLAPFRTAAGDLPVPGDYQGIGRALEAVYRPSDATWYYRADDGTTHPLGQFGWAGHDIPVPGDYDGTGRTELAVYRPETGQWFVQSPGGNRELPAFGWPGHDIPVPADYTGSGVTQQAVYRPTTGEWFVAGTAGVFTTFGWPGHDVPVPGFYAAGGKSVPAVYRPETGQWFVAGTAGVFTNFGWPTPAGQKPLNDIPTLARTGTLNGLPVFGGGPGGTISAAGGNHGTSVAPPRANVNVAITPAASLPAPSFVKAPSRRPSPGLAARAHG